jgi:hypothetical protein
MDALEAYLERIASSLEAIEAQNQNIVMSLEQIKTELNWVDPLSATWNLKAEVEDIKSNLDSGLSDILQSLQDIQENTSSLQHEPRSRVIHYHPTTHFRLSTGAVRIQEHGARRCICCIKPAMEASSLVADGAGSPAETRNLFDARVAEVRLQ